MEDHYSNGHVVYSVDGEHNHAPITARKWLRPDCRSRVRGLLETGLRPTEIELHMQEEAYVRGDFAPLTVPTPA